MSTVKSVKEVFDTLPLAFNAGAAKGLNKTYQFKITGEGGGTWNLKITDGTIEVIQGNVESPDVTFELDADTYLRLVNGEADVAPLYLEGAIKVTGDVALTMKLTQLFQT